MDAMIPTFDLFYFSVGSALLPTRHGAFSGGSKRREECDKVGVIAWTLSPGRDVPKSGASTHLSLPAIRRICLVCSGVTLMLAVMCAAGPCPSTFTTCLFSGL